MAPRVEMCDSGSERHPKNGRSTVISSARQFLLPEWQSGLQNPEQNRILIGKEYETSGTGLRMPHTSLANVSKRSSNPCIVKTQAQLRRCKSAHRCMNDGE